MTTSQRSDPIPAPAFRIIYPRERERNNQANHGYSLADAVNFEWTTAHVRRGQFENRATGMLADKVVTLAYRDADATSKRVTLLRAASEGEGERYRAWRTRG